MAVPDIGWIITKPNKYKYAKTAFSSRVSILVPKRFVLSRLSKSLLVVYFMCTWDPIEISLFINQFASISKPLIENILYYGWKICLPASPIYKTMICRLWERAWVHLLLFSILVTGFSASLAPDNPNNPVNPFWKPFTWPKIGLNMGHAFWARKQNWQIIKKRALLLFTHLKQFYHLRTMFGLSIFYGPASPNFHHKFPKHS